MRVSLLYFPLLILLGCSLSPEKDSTTIADGNLVSLADSSHIHQYSTISLSHDSDDFTNEERHAIHLLKEAADIADEIFWYQSFGLKSALPDVQDSLLTRLIEINYGPYNRLDNFSPLISNFPSKPPGSNFYPSNITLGEYNRITSPEKDSPYSILQRDSTGNIQVIPYHLFFAEQHQLIARKLIEAAGILPEGPFADYLALRAEALMDDQYGASEYRWLDVGDYKLDFMIGPLETYEDQFLGFKAAHQAILLKKKPEIQKRLQKFVNLHPELQASLPVEASLKPGISGIPDKYQVYDVIYARGLFNTGPKSIGLNFPQSSRMYPGKGTRRILFDNIIRTKYERILKPISQVLIHYSQRDLVNYPSFADFALFHEMSHGLGIKRVIGSSESVQESLRQYASILEEAKGDAIAIHIIHYLHQKGKLEIPPEHYYSTILANVLRAARFGAGSDHGRANMLLFNAFLAEGAFYIDPETETYMVKPKKVQGVTDQLIKKILDIQGRGDYGEAAAWIRTEGRIKNQLRADLDRLDIAGIPVDLLFED